MRIISKFHDYYDSVMQYGQDISNCYIRKTEEKEICINTYEQSAIDTSQIKLISELKKVPCEYEYFHNEMAYHAHPFIIIVSDIPHLGYKITDNKKTANYFYNIEDIDIFIKEKYPKIYKSFKETKNSYIFKHFTYENVKKAFDEFDNQEVNICLKEKVPIVYLQLTKYQYHNQYFLYVKNPVLKDLCFYTVLDAYSVYQKISMFMDGIIGRQSPETIEVSDKTKIDKRGYDKWSFRKEGKNSK